MLDARLYYPNYTWDDIKLQFVPRVGETVHFAANGRTAQWTVTNVEWFIDQSGAQSVVLSVGTSQS